MTLDVSKFLETAPKEPQFYKLHSVLIHSGDLNTGHYYALIRPEIDGKWFRFDDDKVLPVCEREVLEANFGGVPFTVDDVSGARRKRQFFTNAYMLIYIREKDEANILAPITDTDIPAHLSKF